MTVIRVDEPRPPTDTRQRLLDVTAALISQHGFAGTSLQMIADELGFTKAAIYHHFQAREQLLVALLEPMRHQIRDVVETAENQRTPRTQMQAMLHGFAGVVAKNRSLAAVVVFDPSVHRVLQEQPEWGDLIARQLALLVQLEPGPTGIIKATAALTGLAGAATGAPPDVDEHSLIEQLCDIGRRVMGLRQPRRQRDDDSTARARPQPSLNEEALAFIDRFLTRHGDRAIVAAKQPDPTSAVGSPASW